MTDKAIPFSEWMRGALFDPQRGYYARNIRTVGRGGDFSTSGTISRVLGEAIAAWLAKEIKLAPSVRTVIEVGGGEGSLMRDTMKSLGFWRRRHLRFIMVESSTVLREKQKNVLPRHRVEWFDDLPAALDACEGRAFIFHNELLDAFPVALVQWDGTSWKEVWLENHEGRWMEQLRDLTLDDEDARHFSALAHPSSEPQRRELGTAADAWLRQWAGHWRQGAMLTLDYGDVFPQLYHRKPRGTLRAYLHHQVLTGTQVYENMGRQDITADVNFTDIMRRGEALGWSNASFADQRQFFQRHLRDFEKRIVSDSALDFLTDEDGAGAAFKVLSQRQT